MCLFCAFTWLFMDFSRSKPNRKTKRYHHYWATDRYTIGYVNSKHKQIHQQLRTACIKHIEAQQTHAGSRNNAIHDFHFCFFSQFLQSQRSCSLYSIRPALYILKMQLIHSTLFQSGLKLHAAKAVSLTLQMVLLLSPNLIPHITKGLSPLKPTNDIAACIR